MSATKKIAPARLRQNFGGQEKKKTVPIKKSTRPEAKRPAFPKAPATKQEKKETEEKQKLRIRVRAYDHKILDISIKQIVDTVLRSGAEIQGPIPLPTEIRKYTVNRSSFVHKDAREQFEMRIHKRLIDILNPGPKIIDALTNLNLPAGVDIEVKMI